MDKKGLAITRYMLGQEGYEVREIGEYPKSDRRVRAQLVSILVRECRLSPMQQKLLKALADKGSLDRVDVEVATDTKVARALVRDTKKRLKSHQYFKDIVTIGSFRDGSKWRYSLKILPEHK